MPEIVYVNGRIVAPHEAVVSVNDRGLLFGDAVYEVIRSYHGRLWAVERHMRRLRHSLDAIDLTAVNIGEIEAAIRECHRASGFPDAAVYLQITRGVAPRSHAYPADLRPTIIITVRDIAPLLADVDPRGVAAVTARDLRWGRCDIKSTNLLANVLAKTEAHRRGAHEAILVDAEGFVTEGTSTSVFWVDGETLFTTPAGPAILPGITREFVIGIAADEGIPFAEQRVPVHRFRRSDEVFLAGTGHDVCPVTSLDGEPVGSGRPGPITELLRQRFAARVAAGDDAPR